MLDHLTPVLLTYNEAPNIAAALSRLAWAKDVVVVDSASTDRTQAEFSRAWRRRSSRSSVFGPCPVTTCMSSSQSGSV